MPARGMAGDEDFLIGPPTFLAMFFFVQSNAGHVLDVLGMLHARAKADN